jgi:hypothetical protein
MVGVGVVKKCVFDDLRVSQGTDRDNRCRHDDSFKFQDFFIFIFSPREDGTSQIIVHTKAVYSSFCFNCSQMAGVSQQLLLFRGQGIRRFAFEVYGSC